MLEKLCVKNFALIDELEVDFGTGLNILTGETGAGKSIIIGSLNFVLGGKADKEMIKNGCDVTEVCAVVSVENEAVAKALEQHDVSVEEDGCVILKRSFNINGKSSCKINGKPVTVGMMRDVSAFLVDIHGQHDHQSLLNQKRHIVLLDKLCDSSLSQKLEDLSPLLSEYKKTLKELKSVNGDDEETKGLVELYRYQYDEIAMAALKNGEDEELGARRNMISNGVRLKQLTDEALDCLYRNDEGSASDGLAMAVSNMQAVVNLDENQESILDDLEDVSAALEAVIDRVRAYYNSIETDTSELDAIETRLEIIYQLKKKYGSTIEDINAYGEKIKKKLDYILNSEEIALQLSKKRDELEGKINSLCSEITRMRKEKARVIEKQVTAVLRELCMPNGEFKINITKKEVFDGMGKDNVEFLISANKGEEPKPLSRIASGGEMSRVMLAMKVVLADADNIDTFIFDEIDTGISGRAAQKVGEKMAVVAKKRQILCITHLPQIAAMADRHFLIEKIIKNSYTSTVVVELSEEKEYNELARLMGGAEITDITLNAAKEMKLMAKKIKENQGNDM